MKRTRTLALAARLAARQAEQLRAVAGPGNAPARALERLARRLRAAAETEEGAEEQRSEERRPPPH